MIKQLPMALLVTGLYLLSVYLILRLAAYLIEKFYEREDKKYD